MWLPFIFNFFLIFFFSGHPYIWRTTVRHDKAYHIFLHDDHINDYFTRWPCKLMWSPYAILSFVTNGVPYDRPYTENFKLNEHTHKGTHTFQICTRAKARQNSCSSASWHDRPLTNSTLMDLLNVSAASPWRKPSTKMTQVKYMHGNCGPWQSRAGCSQTVQITHSSWVRFR